MNGPVSHSHNHDEDEMTALPPPRTVSHSLASASLILIDDCFIFSLLKSAYGRSEVFDPCGSIGGFRAIMLTLPASVNFCSVTAEALWVFPVKVAHLIRDVNMVRETDRNQISLFQ